MTPPGRSEGRRISRFLRTFGLALVGILVVVLLATKALGFLGAGFDYGAPRPTPATLQGYQLSYKVATADWTPLAVDAEAKACGVLAASNLLRDSCVLAVNVDPRWIAAPAFGKLNSEDTPSYLAITWRAVLAGNPSLCQQGGLLDRRLAACQAAATAGKATFADGSVSVVVTTTR